ncbi:unnamed protein product [Nippostrongylus brasiliensis]|uniref:Transposase n=1 Tax=Nippostrongylus brasiliensis TaxID=27835 RepID=A0A0N4YKP9_NIPBR|nr:unnamed protein product [Nippostrongylus brasiliensis]
MHTPDPNITANLIAHFVSEDGLNKVSDVMEDCFRFIFCKQGMMMIGNRSSQSNGSLFLGKQCAMMKKEKRQDF